MGRIFTLVTAVFAVCFAPCFAQDPRAVSVQMVTITGKLTVDVEINMDKIISTKLQGVPNISAFEVTEYAKAFADFKFSERKNAADVPQKKNIALEKLQQLPANQQNAAKEYAEAFANFKWAEANNSNDAEEYNSYDIKEKRYLVARKLADMGFIVVVSGGPHPYIVIPAFLEKFFLLNKFIRYKFAERETGEIEKNIEDAQVKMITEKENGRLYYKALEFTFAALFGSLELTHGSFKFGEFYLVSDKIAYRDEHLPAEYRVDNKTFSKLLNEYENQEFTPEYDTALKIEGNEPWVLAAKGKIKEVAVKFKVEFTVDEKRGQQEHELNLKTMDEALKNQTLEGYIEMLKNMYSNPKFTGVKITYYLIFKYAKE